jgi:hypothetical protein
MTENFWVTSFGRAFPKSSYQSNALTVSGKFWSISRLQKFQTELRALKSEKNMEQFVFKEYLFLEVLMAISGKT